jgi:predicted Zn-dependent peptidase
MLPLLAFMAVAQVPVQQPPRLRSILPNGATVLVERVPGAKTVWTRLFLSSRGAEDTPATHGQRHLLEHLVAVGRDGRIDERLEREGATLLAQTHRDATEFAVDAPLAKLDLALEALSEMLRLRPVAQEEINREVGILRQEGALLEVPTRLSSAAWRVAYGDLGLDPFGDLAAMQRATPASIAELHRRLCVGPNLVIVVAGDIDLDKATAAAAAIVRTAPKVEVKSATRPAGETGRNHQAVGYGEARAVPVPSYSDPKTTATLAAAFAIASDVDGAFVTYTPSGRPGLIVLGRAGENSGLGSKIAGADAASLWPRAKPLATRWLRAQTDDPGANASLRGLLLAQSVDYTPDRIKEAISELTYAQFAAAVDTIKGERVVTVTGW